MKRIICWIKHTRPADWLNLVKKLLPHVAIVISGILIVFFVIDRFNKPMGFMTNEFHKRLTFVLAILAIYYAVKAIALQRRLERMDYQRRVKAAAGERARQAGSAPRPVNRSAQPRPQAQPPRRNPPQPPR